MAEIYKVTTALQKPKYGLGGEGRVVRKNPPEEAGRTL